MLGTVLAVGTGVVLVLGAALAVLITLRKCRQGRGEEGGGDAWQGPGAGRSPQAALAGR